MSKDRQATLFDWVAGSRRGPEAEDAQREPAGGLDVAALPPADAATMARWIATARALHVELEGELGALDLILTNNRQRMVTFKRRGERLELRAHHMFLRDTRRAVGLLVGFAYQHEEARLELEEFIREHREAIRQRPRALELRPVGHTRDLRVVLGQARALFEQPQALEDIQITWGRKSSGKRSIRFGSFDFGRRLIRVHPALDQVWVPDYFVAYIVYHELAHAVAPPRVINGRRCIHHEEFEALERRFPVYEEAIAWEKANLARLLEKKTRS
ncbi:MAG: hypothetical protein AAGI01_01450 [Myxococcota bacterium]